MGSNILTDTFIVLSTDSDGVEVIRDYSKNVPNGHEIEYIFISSEDILYVKIPQIFESSRRTTITDGTTVIPSSFFAVGGDFPAISEKIGETNYSMVRLHYMKTDSQTGNNRVVVTIKWKRKGD